MIKILKGSDTTACGLTPPKIVVPALSVTTTGCSILFRFQGVERRLATFTTGSEIVLDYTAAETSGMRLGCDYGDLIVVDSTGKRITVSSTIQVMVTDDVSDLDVGTSGGTGSITPGNVTIGDEPDLPSVFTDEDVRTKLNKILRQLRGGAAVVAIFLCLSSGAASVTSATKGSVANTNMVVTSVDLSGLASESYVQSAVAQAGSLTPSLATNIAVSVVTSTVPAWAREPDPPVGMPATGLVYAAGSVRTHDGAHIITASDIGARDSSWMPSATEVGALGNSGSQTIMSGDTYDGAHLTLGSGMMNGASLTINGAGAAGGSITLNDSNVPGQILAEVNIGGVNVRETLTSVSNDVDRVYTFITGAGAYLQVTNYMRTISGVIPTLTFWDVTNGTVLVGGENVTTNVPWKVYSVADEVSAWTDALWNDVDSAKADKAWGKYTSRTGESNPYPNDYTMVTTPNVLLSGGGEFYMVVSNTWILTAQNTSRVFSPSDEGVFKISDSDGNSVFEISKTDDMEIGASATSISPNGNSIVITYNTSAQPVLQASVGCLTNWVSESSGSVAGFNVAWSNSGNIYTATLSRPGGLSLPQQAFFRATYIVQGMTAIKHTATSTFEGGIYLNGTRYRLVPKTVGGELVLGLQAWSN